LPTFTVVLSDLFSVAFCYIICRYLVSVASVFLVRVEASARWFKLAAAMLS